MIKQVGHLSSGTDRAPAYSQIETSHNLLCTWTKRKKKHLLNGGFSPRPPPPRPKLEPFPALLFCTVANHVDLQRVCQRSVSLASPNGDDLPVSPPRPRPELPQWMRCLCLMTLDLKKKWLGQKRLDSDLGALHKCELQAKKSNTQRSCEQGALNCTFCWTKRQSFRRCICIIIFCGSKMKMLQGVWLKKVGGKTGTTLTQNTLKRLERKQIGNKEVRIKIWVDEVWGTIGLWSDSNTSEKTTPLSLWRTGDCVAETHATGYGRWTGLPARDHLPRPPSWPHP